MAVSVVPFLLVLVVVETFSIVSVVAIVDALVDSIVDELAIFLEFSWLLA